MSNSTSSSIPPSVEQGTADRALALVRWRWRVALLIVLGALFAAAAVGTGAEADDSARSSSQGHAADVTETPDEEGESDQDQEAAILFDEAREELELREYKAARRRLEIILERFPDSLIAKHAYRILEHIATIDGAPVPKPRQAPTKPPAKEAQPGRGRDGGPAFHDLVEDFKLIGGDRVFFADGSAEIDERAARVLDQKAAWLARNNRISVVIESHADDTGGPQVNAQIALRRAEAVLQHLVAKGIAISRLRIESLAQRRPIATCKGPQCSVHNRRVVLVLNDADERRGESHPGLGPRGEAAAPAGPGREARGRR